MKIRKSRISVLLAGVIALFVAVPAMATHNEDIHSENARLLAHKPIALGEDTFAQGSDLAFQKNLIAAGAYEGVGFFKRLATKPYIKQIGFYSCPGSQGDVSLWGKYMFISVDSPSSNNGSGNHCNNTDESSGKEGIRIVDISNIEQPKQVKFLATECGSHTHVLVPAGNNKLYVYINSYPLPGNTESCPQVDHQRFAIAEVPLGNVTAAKVMDPGNVPLSLIGCHDTTVFPEKDIGIAACINNTNMLDISNPAKPEVLATIETPSSQIDHSSSFSWDGKYAIISDEYGGAAGGGGCAGNDQSMIGAMYFYNIEDPSNPVLEGSYSLPRVPPADDPGEAERFRCTTHLYSILPTKSTVPGAPKPVGSQNNRKYVAVSSYYAGGISAVDFSDPANPEEIGYYIHQPNGEMPDSWSGYWYNNRIYSNDHSSLHGLRVFKMKGGFGKRKMMSFGPRFNPQLQISKDLFDPYSR
jgi:hypothetical protein